MPVRHPMSRGELDTDLTIKGAWIFTEDITFSDSLFILEKAAANADRAGYGQLWVKNTSPAELWFTDDAGLDTKIV